MTATMVGTETATMHRLIEFASDTAQLADQRRDLELRDLIDSLHRDLIELIVCLAVISLLRS